MTLKNSKSKRGFTLIELLVVISIIGLLSSVVLASLNSARGKARFAQAVATMNSIEKAATLEYDDFNNYAPDVGGGATPRFVPKYLSAWPTPPCPGWTYDWENWSSVLLGGSPAIVRVSLRRAGTLPSAVYWYCIDTTGDCRPSDGANIRTVTNKTLTCNE